MKKFSIKEILEIYPHRYPMLLIDNLELTDDGVCIGYKNVTTDEIWFLGHFPENPVLPAIIIIETMSQVGGMCFYYDFFESSKAKEITTIGFIAGYDKVRFYKKVVPGETLRFETRKLAKFSNVGRIKGIVTTTDNSKVAEAEISYSFERVD